MWPFRRKPARTGPIAKFQLYQGGDGYWRWSLMLDATVIADGSKDRKFRRKSDCLKEVQAAWAAAGGAGVIEVDG